MLIARPIWAVATAVRLAALANAQTSTSCNPTETTCDPNEALGMAINVDFTQGEVNSFSASGGTPTYSDDGVTVTIQQEGDAPTLNSVFYIMFGKVEVTMKCASGTGIVSSVVLQSDVLDEIDLEFLGGQPEELQTMYFGQAERADGAAITVTTDNNQDNFITYTIDWSANRIIWSVDGEQVRVLEYNDADGHYPQTPMMLKMGVWAGGDPDNAEGTISWAGGQTDYSQGPYSMTVQSVAVTDYSTGTEYKYGDQSGFWQSIESEGGEINANADEAATATIISGSSSTGSSEFPSSGIDGGSDTATAQVSIPSGWHMTTEGKIVPNDSTAMSTCNSKSTLMKQHTDTHTRGAQHNPPRRSIHLRPPRLSDWPLAMINQSDVMFTHNTCAEQCQIFTHA